MTKFKKIIIVIVSLSLLVLSMVLPSFAYTVDDDGTIDIDKVHIEATPSYYPSSDGTLAVYNFPSVDITELLISNGNWFFFDISIEGLDTNDNITIPSVLLAYGSVASSRSYEFNDTRLGGNVKLKYTVTNNSISGIQLQCTQDSRYYIELTRKIRLTIQIFPHLNTINELLKALPDSDKVGLLSRIEELENRLSNNELTIDELNSSLSDKNQEIADLNQEVFDLNQEIMDLYANQIENENKIKEQEEIILSLREGIDNSNALFSLFDGIGEGIANIFSPLLHVTIGQFTLLEILGFVITIGLVIFLVMLVSKLRS